MAKRDELSSDSEQAAGESETESEPFQTGSEYRPNSPNSFSEDEPVNS